MSNKGMESRLTKIEAKPIFEAYPRKIAGISVRKVICGT